MLQKSNVDMLKVFLFFTLLALFFSFASASAQTGPVRLNRLPADLTSAPGEFLLKFKPVFITKAMGTQEAEALVLNECKQYGVDAEIKASYKIIAVYHMQLRNKTMSVEEAIKALGASANVEYAEPNYIYRINMTPNDPYFGSYMWDLNNTGQTGGTSDADMDAPEAWDITTGSKSVVVGIVDTGISYDHPDLINNIWTNPNEIPGDGIDNDGNGYIDDVHGINAITDSGDPYDDHGHGTHVAGTIGAEGNNGIGVIGVSPNVSMISCKFLDSGGSGYTSDAIKCMIYFTELKKNGVNVKVLNNSWGGSGASQALYDAIKLVRDNDILFVAAAGNNGTNNDSTPFYPTGYALDNIISVAATDDTDTLASWSNYGYNSVDVAAPGVDIISTYGYYYYTPTAGDIFFDDMEASSSNWTAMSPWAVTDEMNSTTDGLYSWSDSPGGNYANSVTTTLTSPSIDLSGVGTQVIQLGFKAKYELEYSFDKLWLDYSGDGGTNWYAYGYLTGSTGGNTYSIYAPISSSYRTGSFRFRFRLVTDSSVTYDGIHIDDIGVGIASRYNSYAWMSGTSMAAPHVTGLAALVDANQPGANYVTLKNAILRSVEVKSQLTGYVTTNGRINAERALKYFTNHAPSTVSVSPSVVSLAPGSGQILTAIYSDADGASDLQRLELSVGSTAGSMANAFRLGYTSNNNLFYLYDDVGATTTSCTPGAATTLQNSRITLDCANSSVSNSTNNAIMVVSLIAGSGLSKGIVRNIYLNATDTYGATSGWVDHGDWTVLNVAPTLGTLSPASVGGTSNVAQTFSAVYSDGNAFGDVKYAYLLINTAASGTNAIYLLYDRAANKLYMRNDANTGYVGSCTAAAAGTLTNTQGTLNCAATTIAGSGNDLTVNWSITPKLAFLGAKKIYMFVRDMSNVSAGWTQKGNWTIINTGPSLGTLTPAYLTSPANTPQRLSAVYSDINGYADLAAAYLLINSSSSYVNAIYLRYDRTANKLYLRNDANTGDVGSCTAAAAGTLTNTQGSLNCAATTIAGSGNNLTVNWNITPMAAFAGAKNVYMAASDMSIATVGFSQKGVWTIITTNAIPTLGSVTPSSLSSRAYASQSFSAVYSDANGYSNLKYAYLLINASVSGANSIYLLYERAANKLYLRNDANSGWVGSCTPGAAGTLTNTQGTLNCGATTITEAGNDLTVNWNVKPKAAFVGTKNLYTSAVDMSSATVGWADKGDWTITP